MKHSLMLIGCGNMASVHCRAFEEIKNIKLVSAVDTQIDKARAFANLYGFERYSDDYIDELQKPEIDIVLVCTHWGPRYKIIKGCLDAGKNVLAEKPLSVFVEEVEELAKIADKKRLKLRVGMMERFRPMFLKVQSLLEENYIGDIRAVSFVHHQGVSTEAWNSNVKHLLAGGVTPNIDCGIHKCDLIRMFTKCDSVSVVGSGQRLDGNIASDNFSHSVYTMANGVTGIVEDCYSTNTRSEVKMWILGTKGRILMEYCGSEARPGNGSVEDTIMVWRGDKQRTTSFHTPFKTKAVGPQLETFIKEIETDADMQWHYENVIKATEMAVASLLAEKTGKHINLPLSEYNKKHIHKFIQKNP